MISKPVRKKSWSASNLLLREKTNRPPTGAFFYRLFEFLTLSTKVFTIRSPILFIVFFCAAFFNALFIAANPPFDVRNTPLERVNVTAHRGAGFLAPENTLSALELTWSMGGVPETDIRTPHDGVLVMFHDNNFSRILPHAQEEMKKKGIADLTWTEVEQLDIGAFRGEQFKGQKVISLAELVEALKKDCARKVYIDVKNVNLEQLARETAAVEPQIILTTCKQKDLIRWKQIAPAAEAFLWMGLGDGDEKLAPKIEALKANKFEALDRIQIHVVFGKDGSTTPSEKFLKETADYIHTNYPNIELQFMPWNEPENKEHYKKLLDLGAGGFGTDRPDVAFEALREYYDAGSTPDWNVRDHIAFSDIIVEAHRGYGNFGPEGSDESFRRAWAEGLVPEADLRLTKDGQIVSFHDNDFKRILPDASDELKSKGVKDLTLAEVKALDVGAFRGEQFKGQRALSMAEMTEILKANPKYKLYCDIKNVDFAQLARETVDVHRQMIICSPKYEELLTWKKVAPNSRTIHWMGGTQEQLTERIAKLEKENFRGLDQLQIHMRIDKDGNFSPSLEFMRSVGTKLRRRGILFQSLIYGEAGGVAENYWTMMDSGVASFATDYPTDTMNTIRKYYAQKQE